MLIVVIFVILASFLAGKYYNRKTYINTTESPAGASQPGNDRQDIPPDSLPH
jgi:hypothetical protein